VLLSEQYKTEIGQYWRFKTVPIATESSGRIYELFLEYLGAGDFLAPIWRVSISRWVLLVRAVTPIIKAEKI